MRFRSTSTATATLTSSCGRWSASCGTSHQECPASELAPRTDLRSSALRFVEAENAVTHRSRRGAEVSHTRDYLPGRFKVVRHIREKLSCRVCDTVVAAPAEGSSRPPAGPM